MRRSQRISIHLAVAAALALLPVLAAERPAVRKHDVVLDVKRFEVDRENFSTQELERAGKIPEDALDAIQHALVGVATRSGGFTSVRKSDASAAPAEGVVVLSGRITDFKPGNRTARLLVGMGAGAQKFEAECLLTDKATGKVLGKTTIIDRKWAGITGGDEDKGLNDFAVKVTKFVEKSLAAR